MHTFTADLDLTDSPLVRSIMGFHITTGAATGAATVAFRDGSSTGDIFIQVEVPQGESRHFAAARPIVFPGGVFVDVTGTVAAGGLVPG